jgi:hypothetical protein
MLTVKFTEDAHVYTEAGDRTFGKSINRKIEVETSDVIEAIGVVQKYYGKDIRIHSVAPSRVFILKNECGDRFEIMNEHDVRSR